MASCYDYERITCFLIDGGLAFNEAIMATGEEAAFI